MIRKYRDQDRPEIVKIWMDYHIRLHGHITTDFRMNGDALLQSHIARSDIYVCVEHDQITGFAEILKHEIQGVFVAGGKHHKKTCMTFLNFTKKNNQHILLWCNPKDYELIKLCKHEGFEPLKDEISENSGEEESVFQWTR